MRDQISRGTKFALDLFALAKISLNVIWGTMRFSTQQRVTFRKKVGLAMYM